MKTENQTDRLWSRIKPGAWLSVRYGFDHISFMGDIRRMVAARVAIVTDLERRHKEGDTTVTLNPCSRSEYNEGDGPTNYVSGSGLIDCPVCKTGKLGYSRAGCNGHIHARCSTDGCVAWME